MTGLPRIGLGLDSHRYAEGRKLVLGGVEIPFRMGLEGHSDADALSHAVADAVLGACGLDDIGQHFPPGDPATRGISSLELLRQVVALVRSQGYVVAQVDSVVVAQEPRLGEHRQAMRRRLAEALDLQPERVGVKFKSAERLGALGRVEGVAAQAIACVVEA